jgi:Ca2+-binding EF-hand superfamily protein
MDESTIERWQRRMTATPAGDDQKRLTKLEAKNMLMDLEMDVDIGNSMGPGRETQILLQEPDKPFSEMTWTEWILTERASNIIGFYIIVNCVLMGFEADLRDEGAPFNQTIGWWLIDNLTVFIFTAESYLKIKALGMRRYFRDTWNIFDFFLVIFGFFDTYFLSVTSNSSALKDLKVLRMLRLIRVAKLFKMFPQLQVLIEGLVNACRNLAWVSLLMSLVTYMIVLVLIRFVSTEDTRKDCKFLERVHGSTKYLEPSTGESAVNEISCTDCSLAANADETVCQLSLYFDNVIRSMYSMFVVLTGENWIDIAAAATHYSPFTLSLFLLYILFVQVCLLNLITGVIVESAYASKDKLAFFKAAKNAKHCRDRFAKVFQQYCDQDGMIRKKQFIEMLTEDDPKAYAAAVAADKESHENAYGRETKETKRITRLTTRQRADLEQQHKDEIASRNSKVSAKEEESEKGSMIDQLIGNVPQKAKGFRGELEKLDICTDRDLEDLFHLFDTSANGSIREDEFVEGCVKTQGSAKLQN